jgi:endonuclease YncB( thermonuclease family)
MNEIEFDHVFRVGEDGSISDAPESLYAPELHDEELYGDGWEFFSAGYTGQYGYNGPIMHNSEQMGGQLERDVLATPGDYAMVVAYWSPEDGDDSEETIAEGWAVVRRDAS